MNPCRYEGYVAIFTMDEIDLYGEPDLQKFPHYMVIDSGPEMQLDRNPDGRSIKKIHRYSRFIRFQRSVRNLIGDTRCKVDPHKLAIVKHYMGNTKTPYETCRKIFRHFKYPYHWIPTFLITMGFEKLVKCPKKLDLALNNIYQHFKKFEIMYRNLYGSKYFLNMNFCAFKFMQLHGFEISGIPLMRTKRKLEEANVVFDEIISLLD